ncbi:MAG: MFS transporter [Pseudomonadota bacterium]
MEESSVRTYGYRWIALLAFSLVQGIMQILWVSFAPITGEAALFYQVTPLQIGFLSMVFMIVYIFVSIPASWAIDTFGIRKGVGFGAVLMGVFGMTRGLFANNYTLVLLSTIMISVSQPFILNSVTAMTARWFPITERATAAGIAVLFQFLGIIAAMALAPYLFMKFGIPGMLNIFGAVSVLGAVVFLVLVKERPPSPPGPEDEAQKALVFEGLKHIFRQRDMIILIAVFFIGLGIFNAVTTWIEQMIAPRGFSITQAGALGAAMMVAGIVGAVVIPLLSDRLRKRRPFVIAALVGACPGLIGVTFATGYPTLILSGVCLGFFLLGGAPVIYQYSAEVSRPAPEATSQGLLMLAGQISGILFIFGMDLFRSESGAMTPFLLVLIGLSVLNVIIAGLMKESALVKGGKD